MNIYPPHGYFLKLVIVLHGSRLAVFKHRIVICPSENIWQSLQTFLVVTVTKNATDIYAKRPGVLLSIV